MSNLIIAIGLILLIEGFLIAIFPSKIKNMLKLIEKTSDHKLRVTGVFFSILGFLIVWYIKN